MAQAKFCLVKQLVFGNTTYYLDTASFCYLGNGEHFLWFLPWLFFFVVARSFHHTRGPSLMTSVWLITSLAQLRAAAPSCASSAAQRRAVPFPGVPWRFLPCVVRYCAVLRGVVRCCAVLCRGECVDVLTLILLNHNKNSPPAQLRNM